MMPITEGSRALETPRITRELHLAGTVAIVNGLFGCGKTLMAPIVGSLERVELMRFTYPLEQTCVLRYLGALDAHASRALIRLQTDVDLYNSMMSRETNFRFTDQSSVWMNAVVWRHMRRLFLPGDAAVIPRIRAENPILLLVTHMLLGISGTLFDALGDRLRFIEVVRHPLYMIKQWRKWIPMAGTDPRAFEIWIEYGGHSPPWYAHGWEDLYLRSNEMDRVIYTIERHWRLGMATFAKLTAARKAQVLMIPFEQFVLQPEPFMEQLERFLGTRVIGATKRMMRKQKVPRRVIEDGVALACYKRYGWEPPEPGGSKRRELEKRRRFAQAEASHEAMRVLDQLCEEYEREYCQMLCWGR